MGKVWRDYGLSIALVGMFLAAWALQTWTGWVEFVSDQSSHGQVAQAFGPDGYVWSWAQATFENWQSEFLQVFVFIVLTTFLVHRQEPRVARHGLRDRGGTTADRGQAGRPRA